MPEIDNRAVNLFGALTLAAHDRFLADLAMRGVGSASQAAALATLKAYPGDTVDQLATVLGITGSGATRLVAKLARDGLVEKRAGRDARSVALHLTRRGRAAATDVLRTRRASFCDVLKDLSDSERQALTTLSEKLLAGLGPGQDWADRTCRFCDYSDCPQPVCPVACTAGALR
jgi:MarR family transcriptional regulator, negative regulator of the multidrug operon emrRAB